MAKKATSPRRTAAQVQKELDDFKKKVISTARNYATEYDWCDDYKDVLRNELGLEVPNTKYVFTLTLQLDSRLIELFPSLSHPLNFNIFNLNYLESRMRDLQDAIKEILSEPYYDPEEREKRLSVKVEEEQF